MHFIKFFKSILKYGKQHFYLFYILIFGLIFTGISVAMLGLTIKHLIDNGFSIATNLKTISLRFLIFSGLLSFGTFLRIFSVNLFSEKLCASIKSIMYEKILDFPITKYDIDGQSQWINFISSDIDIGITSINTNLSLILRNLTMFLGAMILLIINSWKLSLVVLGIVPIIMVIISIFGYRLRNAISEMKKRKNDLFLHFNETILFIKTVKAFGKENYEVSKLDLIYQKILSFSTPLFLLRGFFLGLMIFLMLSSIAAVMYFGGELVISQKMTIGSLSSFIFQSVIAASSIGGIIEAFSDITKNRPIFEKINEILSIKTGDRKEKISHITSENIDISIQNLFFSYPNNPKKHVLQNFNLKIQSGEKIAIIGQSGSGKSTIINLIMRFYEDYQGQIILRNSNSETEIRDLNLKEYRNLFGIVQQDVYLFSGTILENLTYGCENFDKNLLNQLLKKLDLFDFIMSLTNQLNTNIGDKSIQISGGQKQRIAIIRALLKQPKILIFNLYKMG
jgi:ATP-binding cassette subfamily B protein